MLLLLERSFVSSHVDSGADSVGHGGAFTNGCIGYQREQNNRKQTDKTVLTISKVLTLVVTLATLLRLINCRFIIIIITIITFLIF